MAKGERLSGERVLDADQALGREGFKGCGIGQGSKCCAYLVSDSRGFVCVQRTSDLAPMLRNRVLKQQINSRRLPVGEFPQCQGEGR
jgi:hypothetical protein